MNYPHVERTERAPRMSREQSDAAHWDQVDADRKAHYEHLLNQACSAIQSMPYERVTPAYIGQILDTLACKAHQALLAEIAEEIEILSCEITP